MVYVNSNNLRQWLSVTSSLTHENDEIGRYISADILYGATVFPKGVFLFSFFLWQGHHQGHSHTVFGVFCACGVLQTVSTAQFPNSQQINMQTAQSKHRSRPIRTSRTNNDFQKHLTHPASESTNPLHHNILYNDATWIKLFKRHFVNSGTASERV